MQPAEGLTLARVAKEAVRRAGMPPPLGFLPGPLRCAGAGRAGIVPDTNIPNLLRLLSFANYRKKGIILYYVLDRRISR